MSRSTSINQLPSINQVSQQDDEDNAIHEVLAEIQNEQDWKLRSVLAFSKYLWAVD